MAPKDSDLKRILVGSIVLAKHADYMIGNVNQYLILTDECEPIFLYYIYIYMSSCTPECPKLDDKHQYVNPNREALGLRGFWKKVENGSITRYESTISGNQVSYYTIPELNDSQTFGFFIYVYTSDGLYLLQIFNISNLQILLDEIGNTQNLDMYKNLSGEINLADNVDDEVTAKYESGFNQKYGHSSFFPKEEYDIQRGIQKQVVESGRLTHALKGMINATCKVIYAGELLYYKPHYLEHGVIVYWNNQSGHFLPNNNVCRRGLLLREVVELRDDGGMPPGLSKKKQAKWQKAQQKAQHKKRGYFPDELFVDVVGSDSSATDMTEKINRWYTIEYPEQDAPATADLMATCKRCGKSLSYDDVMSHDCSAGGGAKRATDIGRDRKNTRKRKYSIKNSKKRKTKRKAKRKAKRKTNLNKKRRSKKV